jgi:spore maturation protein CgeB
MNIVILGLSLSSSWGNGHATTYRSLIPGLTALGHKVEFLERDVPWYAAHRDLAEPSFCRLRYYNSPAELVRHHADTLNRADAVIIGSYIPDGVEVIDRIVALQPRLLAFYDIDTPVTLAKLARGDEEYLARRQIPHFDVYFSFSGGRTLDRLETQFGAARAVALYCSVDPARYARIESPIEWDLGYLGTYSPDRQPALERLLLEPARRLQHMRFVVAGPLYPPQVDWPPNVDRIEHLPATEHASFYSRQRFTLNITRADMIAAGWSPSVRLFEAAAAGTPLVSDLWPGLDELLPVGEALVAARRTEDVVDALVGMSSEARDKMAAAARRRVLHSHTGLARARQLAAALTSSPVMSHLISEAV